MRIKYNGPEEMFAITIGREYTVKNIHTMLDSGERHYEISDDRGGVRFFAASLVGDNLTFSVTKGSPEDISSDPRTWIFTREEAIEAISEVIDSYVKTGGILGSREPLEKIAKYATRGLELTE